MADGLWNQSVADELPARVAPGKSPRPVAAGAGMSSVALRWSCYAAVALGIVLRLLQLLANRGLSQDEAQLALNIMDRPFGALMGQLDYQQAAPEGFLLIQKLVVRSFGSSEYVLRLVPFLAGSLSLVVLLVVARIVVQRWAVPLAVLLVAVSDPLINWSVYDKQYSVDVLLAVVVLWIGVRLLDRPQERSTLLAFAAVGAAAIWVSHPSVFVLGGVTTVLLGSAVLKRDWPHAGVGLAAAVPWLASFGIFLATSSHNLVLLQTVLRGSPGAFPASGGSEFESLRRGLGEFRYASGIPHFLSDGGVDAGLLVLLFAASFSVVGFVSVFARRRGAALALVMPLGFMAVAWALNKYPLLGRTQLFLVPSFVLLAAEGMVQAATRPRSAAVRMASLVAVGCVTIALAVPAVGHSRHPRRLQDLKPVLEYIAQSQRPSDTVFVYYAAQHQLRYYLECGCAGRAFEDARARGSWPFRPALGGPAAFARALRSVPPRLVVPPFRGRNPADYAVDLDKLQGRPRVWLMLSAVDTSGTALLLEELDRLGDRRAEVTVGKGLDATATYLYDLRPRRG